MVVVTPMGKRPRGEFRIGQRDIFLGEVELIPFYIGARQLEY